MEKNKRAIVATNGNVAAAIEYLVGSRQSLEKKHAISSPVSRALIVGDRVMVLASIDQCRRNTAAADGWTWLASEAAKCGQVFGAIDYVCTRM